MRFRRRALVVSAILHLAALWFIARLPTQPPKTKQRPVTLTLRSPPPEPALREPEPETHTIDVPVRRPRPRPATSTATTTGKAAKAESGAPREIALPSFLTPERPEAPPAPDDIGESTRVRERLAALTEENTRITNAKRKGVDPRSQQIARGIENAFTANVKAIRDHTSPKGAIQNGFVTAFEQWQRDIPANLGPPLPDKANNALERRRGEGTNQPVLDSMPVNFCFGACSASTHEIARLSTRIAIDHDSLGVPTRWTIERSSGMSLFDHDALESVQLALGCMKESAHHVLFCRPLAQPGFGPVPRKSAYVLHGIVRRWSHTERWLDPLFTPSGRKIESGPFSGHFLESAVELVELAYWDPGSQPTSVPN